MTTDFDSEIYNAENKMEVLAVYGKEELAKVYVADMRGDKKYIIEFVESTQPPIPQNEKWVFIVSPSFGCPVNCKMCDAGGNYNGKLKTNEILAQIDYMIRQKYPTKNIPVKKFKIQFARMGEPSLNSSILEVLEKLPQIYNAPGLVPSISTIAPIGTEIFFERLIEIKNKLYQKGNFQLQFSIHTTDAKKRDEIIPIKKWSFREISKYGEIFRNDKDRKITLNFAAFENYPIDTKVIKKYFNPETFLIKLTPLNPTKKVKNGKFISLIDPYNEETSNKIVKDFQENGFDVILSIGELEENQIGSNCGMFVSNFRKSKLCLSESYDTVNYKIESHENNV